MYRLKEKPQVPSIHTWQWTRGSPGRITDGRTPKQFTTWVSNDDKGRLMAIICHNTDLGDGWEREGENEEYFHEFSEKKSYPDGYQYRDLCHDPLNDTPVSRPALRRPPEVEV